MCYTNNGGVFASDKEVGYNENIMTKFPRKKREDTKMGTVEKKYDVDFGVRSDKKLGNYLKERGFPSLSKLLDASSRKKSK